MHKCFYEVANFSELTYSKVIVLFPQEIPARVHLNHKFPYKLYLFYQQNKPIKTKKIIIRLQYFLRPTLNTQKLPSKFHIHILLHLLNKILQL